MNITYLKERALAYFVEDEINKMKFQCIFCMKEFSACNENMPNLFGRDLKDVLLQRNIGSLTCQHCDSFHDISYSYYDGPINIKWHGSRHIDKNLMLNYDVNNVCYKLFRRCDGKMRLVMQTDDRIELERLDNIGAFI